MTRASLRRCPRPFRSRCGCRADRGRRNRNRAPGKGSGDRRATGDWNFSHPVVVAAVAKAYRDAGADFVLSNTFGANRLRLSLTGLGREVGELNRAAVTLARSGEADAGSRDAVYGSVGPTGLSPDRVQSSRAEVVRAFEEQAEALVDAQVDRFVVETSTSTEEALVALAACRATDLETIVSFTFCVTGGEGWTFAGEPLVESALRVRDAGALAFGVNCVSVREIEQVIDQLPTDIPLWLKPNAGPPERRDDGLNYPDSDAEIVEMLKGLMTRDVDYVGGCCGTGPSFTNHLRAEVVR